MSDEATYRYGVYVTEFGGPGGTFRSYSIQGAQNMLVHEVRANLIGLYGACTCGDHGTGGKAPVKRCDGCKVYDATVAAIMADPKAERVEVQAWNKTFHYGPSED
jgi:hypothetical protein